MTAGIILKKAPMKRIAKAMFEGLKMDSGNGPALLPYLQNPLLVSGTHSSFTKGIRLLGLGLAGVYINTMPQIRKGLVRYGYLSLTFFFSLIIWNIGSFVILK